MKGLLETLYWNGWAQLALAALIVALIAGLAERARTRRRDINAVGFMPWMAISLLGLAVALFAAALAIVQG